MKTHKLSDMVRGWFVGDFQPSVLITKEVEVGVKQYKAGDHEDWHYHKVATEITVMISGVVQFNAQSFQEGDIVMLEPGKGSEFRAVTDSVTVVVKLPSFPNDKYGLADRC